MKLKFKMQKAFGHRPALSTREGSQKADEQEDRLEMNWASIKLERHDSSTSQTPNGNSDFTSLENKDKTEMPSRFKPTIDLGESSREVEDNYENTSIESKVPQQVRVIKDGRFYDQDDTPVTTTAKVSSCINGSSKLKYQLVSSNNCTPLEQIEQQDLLITQISHIRHSSGHETQPLPANVVKVISIRKEPPALDTVKLKLGEIDTKIFRTPNVTSTTNQLNALPMHHSGGVVVTTVDSSNGSGIMRPPAAPPRNKMNKQCIPSPTNNNNSTTGNAEEPSSSIPDLEFDGTTVLCRVCGDKASGFHYGVHSCEGCKGFFRRSIQQKIQYRPCTKNQQCSILRINRNRCQYCRLKKCIAVGMSRDAVRFGRVPKREKARILAAMQQSTQNRGQQRALATELDDQPRLLAAVLRAHMETCEFTREKVSAMRRRARDCPSYSMPTLACPLNPAPELQSEQEFSQRFAHVIRGVIDFAGMIPGFQLLTQDDKFTLLKAGLFDALFVRLICMFDSSINSIICLNGQVMRRDGIQNGANARFLVDSTFNFAERMNSMQLTDAEIGLFCAIVLITPDRPGLRNVELIEKMYTKLKACLQQVIVQNRPGQPEFLADLLKTLPDLRTLSTLHTEKLVVFRTEHKELLRQQMWSVMDDDAASKSPGSSSWGCDNSSLEDVAKSPMGSVSSTESGDILGEYHPHLHHNPNHSGHHMSQTASSAPLLAATLAGNSPMSSSCTSSTPLGPCPITSTAVLRNRANSGSSVDEDLSVSSVASTAHLTQNGLTITPVVRHLPTSNGTAQTVVPGAAQRYRKLDSPTDSGIESGNEKQDHKLISTRVNCSSSSCSSGSSSCSSPRSTVDDGHSIMTGDAHGLPPLTVGAKKFVVEDMPVLKRVLQAPPLYDTNSLMDEAYKPHKKFRAMRSSSSSSGGSVHKERSSTNSRVSPSPQSDSIAIEPTPVVASSSISSASSSPNSSIIVQPPPIQQMATGALPAHQSQLHMHLTRPTTQGQFHQTHQSHHQHQSCASSLSSTHSVLAKSLMEEPRMTPEQMKRSDIIQNYIKRETAADFNASIAANSRSPSSSSASSSSMSPRASPSSPYTAIVAGANTATSGCPFAAKLRANSPFSNSASVITTTTTTGVERRTPTSSKQRYFQSPHSTSSPRLMELQVDIADAQPVDLSKKSPSPSPIPQQQPASASITVTTRNVSSPPEKTATACAKVLLEV